LDDTLHPLLEMHDSHLPAHRQRSPGESHAGHQPAERAV
jgi:hypothetical protein